MSEITKKHSTWYKVQSYLNVLNHIMNGSVACFLTLYLIREGRDSFSWHVFLTTIGYQLLMAEAIMVFYTPNSWTYFHSYKTKKHLHWILQLIATIFIITGNVIISTIRTTPHFKTVHAITGRNYFREKSISLKHELGRSRSYFDDSVGNFRSARSPGFLRCEIHCNHETGYQQILAQFDVDLVLCYGHGQLNLRLQIWFNTRYVHDT